MSNDGEKIKGNGWGTSNLSYLHQDQGAICDFEVDKGKSTTNESLCCDISWITMAPEQFGMGSKEPFWDWTGPVKNTCTVHLQLLSWQGWSTGGQRTPYYWGGNCRWGLAWHLFLNHELLARPFHFKQCQRWSQCANYDSKVYHLFILVLCSKNTKAKKGNVLASDN